MPIHKNGDSLRRTIFFAYIAISFIWIVNLTYRIKTVERVLNQRTPYVQKILEMEARVLQIEKNIDLVLKHHVELYEDLKNEQQK